MSHPQRKQTRSRIWNGRTLLAGTILLVFAACGYFIAGRLGAFTGPRPMFHHHIGPTRGFFPAWQFDGYFGASDGSVAYVDTEYNIIVVFVPDFPGWSGTLGAEKLLIEPEDGTVAVTRSIKDRLYLLRSASDYAVLDVPPNTGQSAFVALQRTGVDQADGGESVWPIIADVIENDELRSRLDNFLSRDGD